MLNKELFLGSTQGQRKVKLTIGRNSTDCGYVLGDAGSLDLLPYWGAMKAEIQSFSSYTRTGFYLTDRSVVVTAYVEGYPQAITSGSLIRGDIYNMVGHSGDVRYLTFDPPRRVLGSSYGQTDLGRGYYVEEAPWEAQDAE